MANALPCRWRMFSPARRISLRFLCVIACAPLLVATPTRAASTGVKGALEEIDPSGVVSGWAQDLSNPSLSIQVHLYVDGTAGAGGTFVAAVSANAPRTEPVAGSHGFRYPIPSKYRDGEPHTLYAYGIAVSGVGSDNMLLSAEPQTFVLESTVVRLDNGVIQFGVEPRCGGTLVEVSWRGRNFVNNADCTGRQVQAALYDGNAKYDGCSGCEGNWGWDPVQGGDIHNFGSPLLAIKVTADSVYIATRPNEWASYASQDLTGKTSVSVRETYCVSGKYISGLTAASSPQCLTSATTPTTSIHPSTPFNCIRLPIGDRPGQ